jgi:uncharacterized membrane protein YvbJ
MKEPFRIRAKKAIIEAYTRRLFLLRHGKSKNFITHGDCTRVQETLAHINSNRQLAIYTAANIDFLLHMVPDNHTELKATLKNLAAEAESILTQPAPQAKTMTMNI